MKILLTTDTWTPTVNGVVTSTVALRTELQARGHEVRVLTLAGSGRTYTEDGVTYLGSLDAGAHLPRRPAADARPPTGHCAPWPPGSPTWSTPSASFSTFAPPGSCQSRRSTA